MYFTSRYSYLLSYLPKRQPFLSKPLNLVHRNRWNRGATQPISLTPSLFLEPDFETNIVAPGSLLPVSYAQHLIDAFPDRFTTPEAA